MSMKISLMCFLSVLFMWPQSAQAQYALVTSSTQAGNFFDVNVTINSTGADLIMVCVNDYSGNTETTVSENKSNTLHALTTYTESSEIRHRSFYMTAGTVGSSHTFSAISTGSFSAVSMSVLAFSGSAASPLDQQNGDKGTSVATVTTGSITPTEDNELIVSCLGIGDTGSLTPTVNSSMTSQGHVSFVGSNNYGSDAAYKIQTSAAAINPTWDSTSTGQLMVANVVSFKAATVSCTPDHLTYTAQPSNAQLGATLGTISVAIKDSGGTTCTSATNTVTLAKTGGTCTGMTLNGTVSGAATAGVFTTTNVTLTVATGSCTLDATASGLTGATSSSVTISCTPSKVVFTDQPASAVLGATLGTIIVAVQNSSSNTCPAATNTVTLSKTSMTCTGMTLNGTVSGAASSGLFTTTNVNMTVATGSCTLDANASGLTGATSSSFTISPGSYDNSLLMLVQ